MKRIWIPQAISSVLLIWALNPENPYVYYTVLRLFCCASFAYLAFHASTMKKDCWKLVLGITAIVYNPFVPIHLTRDIWSVLNVMTVAVAVASVFAFRQALDVEREEQTKI